MPPHIVHSNIVKKLKKVYIEITNICNLSCPFCAQNKRAPAFMTVEQFELVIRNIKPVTNSIYFHVLGEPLMHNKIGEMLDICATEGMNASITTNATRISDCKIQLIGKKALRQMNYSLHSILQNGSKYKQVLDDLLTFIDETRELFFHCLRFWNIGDENEQSAEIMNTVCAHFGYSPKKIMPVCGNGIQIAANVFLQADNPFSWPHRDGAEIAEKGRCMALRHNCGILVDGTVVPCCLDAEGDLPLGNIFSQPLSSILESERAKKIYDGFSRYTPVEPFCKSCGFLLRLNGKRKF